MDTRGEQDSSDSGPVSGPRREEVEPRQDHERQRPPNPTRVEEAGQRRLLVHRLHVPREDIVLLAVQESGRDRAQNVVGALLALDERTAEAALETVGIPMPEHPRRLGGWDDRGQHHEANHHTLGTAPIRIGEDRDSDVLQLDLPETDEAEPGELTRNSD